MKSAIAFLFIALILLIACGGPPVDYEKERSILMETDVAFANASIEKGAAEAFRMYLTEDALQLPMGNPAIEGRESIYTSMSKSTTEYTLAWKPERAEVSRATDMGWTWGIYTMTWYDENGQEQSRDGKYLNIWRKMEDGSWKVVVDMGN